MNEAAECYVLIRFMVWRGELIYGNVLACMADIDLVSAGTWKN